MSLEEKVAYWVNLGVTPYHPIYRFQEILARLRKEDKIKDVILATQHYPEVNFGNSNQYNEFSEEFLELVRKEKGEGYNHEDILSVLSGIGMGFSSTSRGGGVTVFAPGQFVYYPIVDYEKITGRTLDVAGYKSKIYRIMFETLSGLGVEGINLGSGTNLTTRRERRDVWINRNGRSLKMGSKGIHFSGKVAYHGFALYIDKEGVDNFWVVKPCGYAHDEVSVTSVEEFLGKRINQNDVHEQVKKAVGRHLNYSNIVELTKEEFFGYLQDNGVRGDLDSLRIEVS